MGVSDRRARQKASLRREIITAASHLFVEEGFDAVTMRKLAARIEYSPTTIYLYFKDKRELFAAVCQDTFDQLSRKFERLQAVPHAPVEHLREGLRTYIEFGLSHPEQYAVTFLAPERRVEKGPPADAIGLTALAAITQMVTACVERGRIRTDDPELTAQTLWAGIHGVTAALITQKKLPLRPRKALVDRMVETLVTGVRGTDLAATPTPEPEPAPAPLPVQRPAARPVPSRDFSFMD